LQKILERLSAYSFQLSYMPGKSLVLADFLSRAPRDDDSELDRIMPIVFQAQSSPVVYELESLSTSVGDTAFYTLPPPDKIVTRSYAKKMNIAIPPLHKPKPTPRPRTNAPSVAPPQAVSTVDTQTQLNREHGLPVTQPRPPVVPPTMTIGAIPLVRPSIPTKNKSQKPARVLDEPRLVDSTTQPELVEEYSEDVLELLTKPRQLIDKIEGTYTKHVPDQASLNKVLRSIKRKVIRDYNLPIEAQKLSCAQQTSPHFKSIYDYLVHDILPADKKAARIVVIKSEQYVTFNGILFRIFFPSNSDNYCFQLAVPEKYIDTIIGQHHGSGLLLGHGGCTRTYLTIRKNFFFPAMFQRIVAYIQSCNRCQQIKGKRDTARTFHERIPANFDPFETISLDFKSMPTSPAGYRHLMVVTCSMTRFVVCVPLKTVDAPTVCEALIQKVITLFGVPSIIVSDAAASLTGHLVELLCTTLGIQQKLVSVLNHGSLLAERQIKSLLGPNLCPQLFTHIIRLLVLTLEVILHFTYYSCGNQQI
jgi:hypothetical protein